MRIHGGLLGGMTLEVPRGQETRPTGSRAREAVMNLIRGSLEGASVLDLYSGAGGVGLEMVSQGAGHVTFVEQAVQASRMLRKNIDEASRRIQAQGEDVAFELRNASVKQTLTGAPAAGFYQIAWADPPYRMTAEETPFLLERLPVWLQRGGLFLIECSAKDAMLVSELVATARAWDLEKSKVYGEICINILRHVGGKEGD